MKKKMIRNRYADHAVSFIENLTLTGDYSEQPVVLRKWQEQIIRELFGNVDKNGRRKYKKSCWLIPRKSSKSSLAAFCLIYALCNFPPGQKIYSIAPDLDGAKVIFDLAAQIIEQDEELIAEFDIEIVRSTKTILIPSLHSSYTALAKESKRNRLGKNCSMLLVDEFQAIEPELYLQLLGSMGSRTEPLVIYCGTGGDRKDSLGYEITEYAKKVDDGIVKDPSYLPVLYYATEQECEESWDDPKLWKKVMPALGDFVQLDFIKNECQQAKHLPRLRSHFCQYFLNCWQSPSHSWIYDSNWMENASHPLGCSEYVAGFDGASVRDSSSLVLFGRNDEGTFDVIPFVWVCQKQVDERAVTEAKYPQWQKDKLLRVTEGEVQNQEQILDEIIELFKQYNVTKLGVDRFGMQWLAPKMMDVLDGVEVLAINQSKVGLSEPLKRIERLALSASMRHGGHEVMRWHCSNARVSSDAYENISLNKKGAERMDSISALANAVSLYDWTGYNDRPSVYESQGVMIF